MIYEFGVMSNKWSLVADDDATAFISMSLFIGQEIPIAVFSPIQCVLSPTKVLDDNKDTFDGDKIRVCMKTIVKVI